MEWINFIFSLTLSIFATVISLYNLIALKRNIYVESITKQRIEWINTVRKLVYDFIELYLLKENNSKLILIKYNIVLYMRPENKDQEEFTKLIDTYTNNADLPIDKLINCSQLILENHWERMKLEAGISKKEDEKIKKKIYKNYSSM